MAFCCGGLDKIAPWTRAKRVPRRVLQLHRQQQRTLARAFAVNGITDCVNETLKRCSGLARNATHCKPHASRSNPRTTGKDQVRIRKPAVSSRNRSVQDRQHPSASENQGTDQVSAVIDSDLYSSLRTVSLGRHEDVARLGGPRDARGACIAHTMSLQHRAR